MKNIKRITHSRSDEYEDFVTDSLLEHSSRIRERLRQGTSPELREQRRKLERERYRENRRKFWRGYFKIMIPLWMILAAELLALWYVKTH